MAFFSLTDINFNTNRPGFTGGSNGPLEQLDANGSQVSSRYASNTFRYPSDLGSNDKNHYMVIHINEQRETQFKGTTFGPGEASSNQPTVVSGIASLQSSRGSTNLSGSAASILGVASDLISKVEKTGFASTISNFIGDAAKTGISSVLGNSNGANAFTSQIKNIFGAAGAGAGSFVAGVTNASFSRTIRRTTDTIALYMPDTLNFTYNQSYSAPALGGDVMSLVGAASAGASAIDAYKNSSDADKGKNMVKNLSPFAQSAGLGLLPGAGGNLGKVLFAAGAGLVTNPMMEMIYSAPDFRSFTFSFMFYPRDEKEAFELQLILDRLRFHQAPEIKSNTGGFFLIPPSEFDIQFYYNGVINKNIPQISTCVLQNIDVDYAPNGWAAYEVPKQPQPGIGGTGMPVAIRLNLQFRETEIMTKDSYRKNAGSNKGTTTNADYPEGP